MPTRKTPTKSAASSGTTTTRRRRTATPRAKAKTAATTPATRRPGTAGIAAVALAGTAAAGAAIFGLVRLLARRNAEGTVPTDLMTGEHPDGSARAIEAFRPDPTAPVPASEREALRPALVDGAAE